MVTMWCRDGLPFDAFSCQNEARAETAVMTRRRDGCAEFAQEREVVLCLRPRYIAGYIAGVGGNGVQRQDMINHDQRRDVDTLRRDVN